jgi:tetratricopeptide (TPR) repeat protein
VVVPAIGVTALAILHAVAAAAVSAPGPPAQGHQEMLADAQLLFYNGHYEAAAALTLSLRESDPENLEAYELRSSALLFQLKALLDQPGDKGKPFQQCAVCPGLLADFLADFARGRALARAQLQKNGRDETALFFLGKLDLNYVWLHLGPLGRKTGWDEYWEARKSLDVVLGLNPKNVRARVARAWIDYIVDTRMPRGTRWILGGGSKKRALAVIRDAANTEADVFVRAEALFALWDLEAREKNFAEAVTIAGRLTRDFPDNQQLTRFLEKHDPSFSR